jgi:hypothetical protein
MMGTNSDSEGGAAPLTPEERVEMLSTVVGAPVTSELEAENPGIRLGHYLGQFTRLAVKYGSGYYVDPRTQHPLGPREYLACLSCLAQKIHLTAELLLKR